MNARAIFSTRRRGCGRGLTRERICHGYIMRFHGYYGLIVRVSLALFLSLSVLFFLIIILLGFIFFLSDDGVFVH